MAPTLVSRGCHAMKYEKDLTLTRRFHDTYPSHDRSDVAGLRKSYSVGDIAKMDGKA
jgi:hypothetical protein